MMLLLLLILLLGVGAPSGVGVKRDAGGKQTEAVSDFLAERAAWHPMCLYTFDDDTIGNGAGVHNWVPEDGCPFGALEPDDELVTSLNVADTFWQLGVHVEEDSQNDSKRVQLASVSTVSAREFFTMAAVRNESMSEAGVTFEMVLRRREKTNQSMTLFSIANEFDNCVDPGFRVDVNQHQVLVFIYFLPVLEEGGEAGVEACYEQRLFSVDSSTACQLPPLANPVERTPPVQIMVTLDPSSERGLWKTDFYMSYTNIETMERVDCVVHDEQHPPNPQVLNKLIEGRYRLYLGNSPRNVSSPRERKRLAPARDFRSLYDTSSSLNSTERLRAMLKQKLMSISGPRLPKAMRIFGDNSFSLHILGISFPPLSEDTPLAYIRGKLADFKEQYGDQIVNYLVNLIQEKADSPVVVQHSQEQSQNFRTHFNHSSQDDEFSRAALFHGASSATFDLFHFAIYRRVVSEEQVTKRQWMMPSRQFSSWHQNVRIQEDSVVQLNLTMLHGVFDDLRLELRGVPEFGRLLLFPNQTVMTASNLDEFRELPLEYQRGIFFRPEPDQNNDNLPLPNPVAFSRRLKPYATISFGIADSLAERDVNKSVTAQIDIFVDAVNDAPRPRSLEMEIPVVKGVPVVLELEGDDIDGASSAPPSSADFEGASDFLSSFTFSNATTATEKQQLLKMIRLPQLGKLFDCNASCYKLAIDWRRGMGPLELGRIYRNTTVIRNATLSTRLLYVYYGWGFNDSEGNTTEAVVVDELSYSISHGDRDVLSDVAVVKFVLVPNTDEVDTSSDDAGEDNVLAVVQMQEDSLRLLNFAELDPLGPFIDSQTRFEVTKLPLHGAIYQYNRQGSAENCSDAAVVKENSIQQEVNVARECVGRRIATTSAIVTDPLGRIVYVPKFDYFNLQSRNSFDEDFDPDFFEYRVLNITQPGAEELLVHEDSLTALFANGSKNRRVEMEVINVPDDLIVLPPFIFSANSSNGDTTPTPVVFTDPDSTDPGDQYQVNLQAADGISEFELGFAITDDDIMTECPFERPCTLVRSVNGSRLNGNLSNDHDTVLQFHISTQLYDASHVQVSGTKNALKTALTALSFRELSTFSPGTVHTSEFSLWVKRLDIGNSSDLDILKAETVFTIVFHVKTASSEAENLLSALNSQLHRYIQALLILIIGWFVLANASCFSVGFCCCCCSKARKKRRKRFEQRQRLFQAQVAQNNHEYSVLLMSLADLLLEPDLLVSMCLLQSCVDSQHSRTKPEILVQAFILRSLLPILESERQGTRLVLQLMAHEYADGMTVVTEGESKFQRQEFLTQPSTASRALACFCRGVGAKWLTALLSTGDGAMYDYRGIVDVELNALLDRLQKQISTLPAEIVILCRACKKLFMKTSTEDKHQESELNAVHLVFFNHFLGPALVFSGDNVLGFSPSIKQRSTLRGMAYRLVGFSDQWNRGINTTATDSNSLSRCNSSDSLLGAFAVENEDVAVQQQKYQLVLDTIHRSSTVASSYDPSNSTTEVDCNLMGMCLMNIHSLLDSHFVPFRQRLIEAQAHLESEHSQLHRITRLLKTLNFPLADIHELVTCAQFELESDPLLWNGFSLQEWQDRAAEQLPSHPPTPANDDTYPKTTHEFILEHDDTSPQEVDWVTTS